MTRRQLLLASAAAPRREWVMPEETAPHKRTWMAFGAHQNIWGAKLLPQVERDLVAIARAVAKFEPVTILAPPESISRARQLIGADLDYTAVPMDDLWIRDSGPVFVRNSQGQKAAVDLNFSGWGDKQFHDRDAALATFVARKAGVHLVQTNLVLEGGAIETDGQGTAILAESCTLNANRNPDISKADFEREMATLLGVEKIVWIPGAKGRDMMDGHPDSYARFARPGVVLVGQDGKKPETSRHAKILQSAADGQGRKLEVIPIPAAYLGFYTCNGAIIAQDFGDAKADRAAAETLRKAFPGRQVVQLNVNGLAAGGGSVHGVTLQEPASGAP